ncbi:porin family protein [Sulfurovum riftiae]|uniref:Outer membrane protein beta-barrel domain-containing protein n=1 Tax=Sulfurovum riftiae TaxID=1630136 RepID=A0A151CIR7_9BACT|nr:porin family protein [Sulfurovum riftiae]KYJ87425.1 hypothetical protein AS592_09940 [Sulfurovum riftiae]
MKKGLRTAALAALLSTGILQAGGAVAPVAPVPIPIDSDGPNPFYVGVGLMWAGISADCYQYGCEPEVVRLKDSTWGGIVRAGWEYNQYVGIEARALTTAFEEDWADSMTHYGIYLKPQYPVSEKVNIYGLLGYGRTKIETTCFTPSDYSYNGFSWGVGLEYDLSSTEDDREEGVAYDRPFDGHMDQERGWGLWVDYQNLLNDEGYHNFKTNIVTFGVTYDF